MSEPAHPFSDGLIVPLAPADPQPDAEQRRASHPTASVWVGASAGSGKTKVLADRVTRLLLAGVKPQKILCLTFTRAAAAEMSIRLTRRLARWATCSDDALRHDLDELQNAAPEPEQLDAARRLFATVLACPGGMRIRTLHAFAQEILRRFPLEAGLSPHFALQEEADAAALLHETQNDLLQEAAANPDGAEGRALRLLVKDLGEDSFTSILREASKDPQRLNAALDKAGGFAQLVNALRGLLALEPDDTETSILRAAVETMDSPSRVIPAKAGIHHLTPTPSPSAPTLPPHEMDPRLRGDDARGEAAIKQAATWLAAGSSTDAENAKRITDWLAAPLEERMATFHDYCRGYLTAKGEVYARPATKKVVAAHPEILDILAAEATRVSLVKERLDAVRTAEQTEALLTLAVTLIERYAARKAAQGMLDYDDLIRHTVALLRRPGIAPWVLFKLDGGVDHILVDEAQDTSPEQWDIIRALAEDFFAGDSAWTQNRTLFVVGDEKQSIYSFLKADPDAFDRMRTHFRQRINESGKDYRDVALNVSFRSTPAVLKAVDAVFAADHARRGVARDEVRHYPHRREAVGRVEVWPLKELTKDEATEGAWTLPVGYEPEQDPAVELAATLAERIKAWVKSGATVYDRTLKQDRPLTPGDVMILVQTRGRFVDHLVRQLKERNVPVTGVDRMTLAAQLAVMDLVALLQFTLLPEDDLTLATALRGPLLGGSEDQLMQLAIGRTGSLWQSLKANEAYAPWRDYLQRCLDAADNITPFAMLARLLSEPCPADEHSGRRALWARLGPDAQDPMDELLNAAQDYGARHTPSLQGFLHWLMASEAEIKRELDSGAGQVRITTVHAAKGLEAPVVILPDTVRVPNKNKLPKFLWDSERQIPFYLAREPINGAMRRLREGARQKQLEEYRRLLYVALTRAADRLYVCGWKPSRTEGFDESWYHLIHSALKPLHEPSAEAGEAVVAFADPDVRGAMASLPLVGRVGEGGVPPAEPLAIPSWLHRVPPPEPSPPRPLTPSRPTEDEPALAPPQDARRFARGRIIHRLLQSLPEVEAAQQESVALRFLANPQHALTPDEQADVGREVLALLRHPDHAPLFAPGSRAEVPIVGRCEDRLIAGQVDRLCVRDGEVWIVDYKTNRPPPQDAANVPAIYRRQMEAYRSVLREIYPDKMVRCFLLWTYDLRLMEL